MNNNKDRWVELPVSKVGVRVGGDVYPEQVLQVAIKELADRQPVRPLRGECCPPRRREREASENYIRRFCGVNDDQVSHLIDVNTMKIKDGFIFAKVKPHGPMADIARQLILNQNIKFGMRALVRYQEGNTTQTENRIVEHCDIVSFDLINPDN